MADLGTRVALAVAKARGVKLGNPRPVPAAPTMAAVAQRARSRQVAERTADMPAVRARCRAKGRAV